MDSQFRGHGAALVLAFVLAPPAAARGEPACVVTWGDTVSPFGEVAPPPRHELPAGASEVGYKYSYHGVLWLNVWTWGGEYCVHDPVGKRYRAISRQEAARLLGKPEEALEVPFTYRFPPGLFL